MNRRGSEINGGQPAGGVDGGAPADSQKKGGGETSLDFARRVLDGAPDEAINLAARGLFEVSKKSSGDRPILYKVEDGAVVPAFPGSGNELRESCASSLRVVDAVNGLSEKNGKDPEFSDIERSAVAMASILGVSADTPEGRVAKARADLEKLSTFQGMEGMAALVGDTLTGKNEKLANVVEAGRVAAGGLRHAIRHSAEEAARKNPNIVSKEVAWVEVAGRSNGLTVHDWIGAVLEAGRDTGRAAADFASALKGEMGFIDKIAHPGSALYEAFSKSMHEKFGGITRAISFLLQGDRPDKDQVLDAYKKDGLNPKQHGPFTVLERDRNG